VTFDARQFFVRMARALNEGDVATLSVMVHPEVVSDFPQSGERLRGIAAFLAQIEEYPGGPPENADLPPATVLGDEERWAITPAYTVVPLAGANKYTVITRAVYPDGSKWHVVCIVELRDELLYRSENFFAPDFEPPEWRREFAEIVARE